MKCHAFLGRLLTGALGLSGLTAGEPSQPFSSDDLPKLEQLHEENTGRNRPDLAEGIQKILRMQTAVREGTKSLHDVIQDAPDKKPRSADRRASRKLSDKQKDIVVEATNAIDMLEAEGSAVAFATVFRQLREDMKQVQRRLAIGDVSTGTQAIEQEIIDTLQEMIEALKKR